MNINKNSWHYKVFKWTYTFPDGWAHLRKSDLCTYIRRICIVAPFMALLVGMVTTIWYALIVPIALLVGFLPTNIFDSDSWLTRYPKIGGWFYPWYIVAPSLFIFLEYLGFTNGLQPMIFTVVIDGFLLGAAIIVGSLFLSRGETARLVIGWVSARKRSICPLIEFTDAPTSTNMDE